MKCLLCLVALSLTGCPGKRQGVVRPEPRSAPIEALIESCEVTGDGLTVTCPKQVFTQGLDASIDYYEQALQWRAEHAAIAGLHDITRQELEAARADTDRARTQRWIWGGVGAGLGALIATIAILAN